MKAKSENKQVIYSNTEKTVSESVEAQQINKIFEIIRRNNGYATTADMVKEDINPYYINSLKKAGKIVGVKRGVYRANEEGFDFNFDVSIVDVAKIVPDGVLCLSSALAYHGLTTYMPRVYEVAIERDKKIVIPEYPPIKLVYFSKNTFETGIETKYIGGHPFRVYDLEKTVIDCLRYRGKIGKDIVKETLENYFDRNDRKLDVLLKYAKICRVQKILNTYMEVLI